MLEDLDNGSRVYVEEALNKFVKASAWQSMVPKIVVLIEFCTSEDSMIGKLGETYNVHVHRVTKENRADTDEGFRSLAQFVKEHPGCDIWGSLHHHHGEATGSALEKNMILHTSTV